MVQVDERTTLLNDRPENPEARYVLYFMQISKRTSHNFALNFAIEAANQRKLPLVIYEGLKYYYPWANDRLHTFILEGVEEKRSAFAAQGIRYVFTFTRRTRPRDTVRDSRDSALIVTDDSRASSSHITTRASPDERTCGLCGRLERIIPLSKSPKKIRRAHNSPEDKPASNAILEPLTTRSSNARARTRS